MGLRFLLACFCLVGITSWAESRHWVISPNDTDPAIDQVDGMHLAWAPAVSNGHLVIVLGGTNSRPAEMQSFDEAAVALGNFVVGVDYENEVISTVCRNNPDPLCFDRFRKEIVLGVDV